MVHPVQFESLTHQRESAHRAPAEDRPALSGTGFVVLAERELGAFLLAVTRRSGAEASSRAASLWIEALEAADLPWPSPASSLRAVTILAASRLFSITTV